MATNRIIGKCLTYKHYFSTLPNLFWLYFVQAITLCFNIVAFCDKRARKSAFNVEFTFYIFKVWSPSLPYFFKDVHLLKTLMNLHIPCCRTDFLFLSIYATVSSNSVDRQQRFFIRPRGYKPFFSCSTQLSTKLSLLINMKMPTIVGIFIFISRENFMLNYI